jgi:hypothetical protein
LQWRHQRQRKQSQDKTDGLHEIRSDFKRRTFPSRSDQV